LILNLSHIVEAIGGTLSGDESARWSGAEIDTRRDVRDKVFFALQGEQTDGHAFIDKAIEGGCVAIVVSKNVTASVPVIQVENPRRALFLLAQFVRAKLDIRSTIAITGSVGKTTTKNILSSLLGSGTMASPASFNNDLGIPLTLLSAVGSTNLVVEVGANACGEIEPLAKLVAPDIAVITSIQKAHLEGFGSVDAILNEKMKLFESLQTDGIAIIPSDVDFDETNIPGQLLRVGESNDADIRVLTCCDEHGYAKLDIGEGFVTLRMLGKHNAMNAALAIVAARFAFQRQGEEYSLHELLKRVSLFEGTAGRLLKEEFNGITIIDDAYNANPASMNAAIEMFSRMKAPRKILVLGDMLELGDQSDVEHRRIGGLVAKQSFDKVILVGNAMASAAKVLLEAIHEEKICDQTMRRIAHSFDEGDVVLLKGSRGLKLERIVESLRDKVKVSSL
jgi:UDP-N-acetylmuramoyl-tripeptide--D-alanyl-D-alanine ligase